MDIRYHCAVCDKDFQAAIGTAISEMVVIPTPDYMIELAAQEGRTPGKTMGFVCLQCRKMNVETIN